MPFFSVSSTCVKTWTLVHLPRFVFNGYSDHVGYFCCSYTVGVSECPDDEPNHKHGFHPSVHFDERHPDGSNVHFMALIFPKTRNWRARLIHGSSLESDHRSRSTTFVPRWSNGQNAGPLNHGGWPLATRNRLVPGFFCSLTRWGFGWQSGVCLMNTYHEMV